MNVRDAAAVFVEAGRAIGHLERLRLDITYLDECAERVGQLPSEGGVHQIAALRSASERLRAALDGAKHAATEHQTAAEALIATLEHPGARLARRLLAAIHGARAGWQRG